MDGKSRKEKLESITRGIQRDMDETRGEVLDLIDHMESLKNAYDQNNNIEISKLEEKLKSESITSVVLAKRRMSILSVAEQKLLADDYEHAYEELENAKKDYNQRVQKQNELINEEEKLRAELTNEFEGMFQKIANVEEFGKMMAKNQQAVRELEEGFFQTRKEIESNEIQSFEEIAKSFEKENIVIETRLNRKKQMLNMYEGVIKECEELIDLLNDELTYIANNKTEENDQLFSEYQLKYDALIDQLSSNLDRNKKNYQELKSEERFSEGSMMKYASRLIQANDFTIRQLDVEGSRSIGRFFKDFLNCINNKIKLTIQSWVANDEIKNEISDAAKTLYDFAERHPHAKKHILAEIGAKHKADMTLEKYETSILKQLSLKITPDEINNLLCNIDKKLEAEKIVTGETSTLFEMYMSRVNNRLVNNLTPSDSVDIEKVQANPERVDMDEDQVSIESVDIEEAQENLGNVDMEVDQAIPESGNPEELKTSSISIENEIKTTKIPKADEKSTLENQHEKIKSRMRETINRLKGINEITSGLTPKNK